MSDRIPRTGRSLGRAPGVTPGRAARNDLGSVRRVTSTRSGRATASESIAGSGTYKYMREITYCNYE